MYKARSRATHGKCQTAAPRSQTWTKPRHTALQPTAVLLRALQPTDGLQVMYGHRRAARRDRDLCSGPAKLCQALQIDRRLDGLDLPHDDRLFIEQLRARALPNSQIGVSPRVGVAYAGEWAEKPLRFFCKHNLNISRFTPPALSG